MADNKLNPQEALEVIKEALSLEDKRLSLSRDLEDSQQAYNELLEKTSDISKQIVNKEKERKRYIEDQADRAKKLQEEISKENSVLSQIGAKSHDIAMEFVKSSGKKREELKLDFWNVRAMYDLQKKRMDTMIPALQEELVLRGKIRDSEVEKMSLELKQLKQLQLVDIILEKTGLSNNAIGKGIKQIVSGTALWKLALEGLLILAVTRFFELDKAAGEFRRKTGLLISQMGDISDRARTLNVEYAKFGIGISDAYHAASELYGVFQTTAIKIGDMMETVALLSANMGIAAEDSSKILQLFGTLSLKAGTTAKDVELIGVEFAKAAGVAPRLAFEDMARASSETLMFLGKNPIQLMRTAIEARRLGTTIDSMSKSARGFLNFQDSIGSEMEASALLGKSVNFQLARQLAFEGDIEGSRKAALNVIKQSGDFSRMNVYQQEALAKAANMTVGEILTQQNQERELLALKKSTNPLDIAALKLHDEMNKKLREGNVQTEESLAKAGRQRIMDQQRQTVLEQLTNSMKAVGVDLSDALMPIMIDIMPTIVKLAHALIKAAQLGAVAFGFVSDIVVGLLAPFGDIVRFIEGATGNSMSWADYMVSVKETAKEISPWIKLAAEMTSRMVLGLIAAAVYLKSISFILDGLSGATVKIASTVGEWASTFLKMLPFGESIAGIFGTILKWAGPIGLVVNGVLILYDVVKRIINLWEGRHTQSFAKSLLEGLMIFPEAAWDIIVTPLQKIVAWILGKFGLEVPKEMLGGMRSVGKFMGEAVGDGISAIIDELSNVVTVAYVLFKGLGLSILDGLKSVGQLIFDVLTGPFRAVWEWLGTMFLGNSPSHLGLSIVNGIAAVSDTIFDFLTSPFKKAWEFVKSLPLVGKIFTGIEDTAKAVSGAVSAQVEASTTSVVEIKNLDELKQAVDQLTAAALKLGGGTATVGPIAATGGGGNDALAAKMDELINLMKGGGIAVNLDGRLVSKGLAAAPGR